MRKYNLYKIIFDQDVLLEENVAESKVASYIKRNADYSPNVLSIDYTLNGNGKFYFRKNHINHVFRLVEDKDGRTNE